MANPPTGPSFHLGAQPGEIADTVLFPGDPLRAEWIATTYLSDVSCYSKVRGMLGFTGTYAGRRISVQGSGMGQPSLAIYAHELLSHYGVRTIVRVGSCGALTTSVGLRDLVLAMTASTDSAMNRARFESFDYAPAADFLLLRKAYDLAVARSLPVHVGPIAAIDSFYSEVPAQLLRLAEYGVLAVEMETAVLYTLAAKFCARALTILTVGDHVVTGEATTGEERERGMAAMAELALATVTDD